MPGLGQHDTHLGFRGICSYVKDDTFLEIQGYEKGREIQWSQKSPPETPQDLSTKSCRVSGRPFGTTWFPYHFGTIEIPDMCGTIWFPKRCRPLLVPRMDMIECNRGKRSHAIWKQLNGKCFAFVECDLDSFNVTQQNISQLRNAMSSFFLSVWCRHPSCTRINHDTELLVTTPGAKKPADLDKLRKCYTSKKTFKKWQGPL